jgi:hypothetical protein
MPFDGNGTFSLPSPAYPAVAGQTILSERRNELDSGFAAGLSNCLTRDGQSAPSAAIPMGGQRLTNLGAAAAAGDALNVNDLVSNRLVYLTSVAGTNTITGTAPILAAYTIGQSFEFIPANTNTGAVTLNINGLGAKSVVSEGTTDVVGGDLRAGRAVRVLYDGARFVLVNFSSIATTAEIQTGTNDTKMLTPAGLRAGMIVTNAFVGMPGTATVDWNAIPSWVTEIDVHFNEVGTNGLSNPILLLGTAAGFEVAGYGGGISFNNAGAPSALQNGTSFLLSSTWTNVYRLSGHIRLSRGDNTSNFWTLSVSLGLGGTASTVCGGGTKSLADTLTRLRLTTAGGVNLLNTGSWTVAWK